MPGCTVQVRAEPCRSVPSRAGPCRAGPSGPISTERQSSALCRSGLSGAVPFRAAPCRAVLRPAQPRPCRAVPGRTGAYRPAPGRTLRAWGGAERSRPCPGAALPAAPHRAPFLFFPSRFVLNYAKGEIPPWRICTMGRGGPRRRRRRRRRSFLPPPTPYSRGSPRRRAGTGPPPSPQPPASGRSAVLRAALGKLRHGPRSPREASPDLQPCARGDTAVTERRGGDTATLTPRDPGAGRGAEAMQPRRIPMGERSAGPPLPPRGS